MTLLTQNSFAVSYLGWRSQNAVFTHRQPSTDGARKNAGDGGGGRNRTGVHGFAGRCITTLLPRRLGMRPPRRARREFGAGEESRTLDLYLGKVSLYQLSYSRIFDAALLKTIKIFNKMGLALTLPRNSGAGEESRTLDLYLGKVSLYQLSYSRIINADRHYKKVLPAVSRDVSTMFLD